MLPHEKALVKRLEKEPFALIGIDTDSNLDLFKQQREKQGVTWRNVWDGPAGRGPLSRAWNVRGYPTFYILDSKGIVRSVNHGEDLDHTIDVLLDELKRGAANR
jgi:hypothetical protein